MKFLIQRVNCASVHTDEGQISSIGKGILIFVGIGDGDDEKIADKMVKKACSLRIFADEENKTNLSLGDVGGELLLVSQFTLFADCKKGSRPSFFGAGKPEHAKKLYEYIVKEAMSYCGTVKTGQFGADMTVRLENDGPFTIMLDSDEIM